MCGVGRGGVGAWGDGEDTACAEVGDEEVVACSEDDGVDVGYGGPVCEDYAVLGEMGDSGFGDVGLVETARWVAAPY